VTNGRDRREEATGIVVRIRYAAMLLVLGVLLSVPTAGSGVLAADIATTREVQAAAIPFAEFLAIVGNFVGSTAGGLGIALPIIAVLLSSRRCLDAALLTALVLLRATNALFKSISESPRPTLGDGVQITEQAVGPGFPSGHSMGSVLLIGGLVLIAYRTHRLAGLRRPILAVGVGLVLLTGFGRIETGAHWPSDVLGGYLWGLTILLVVALLFRHLGEGDTAAKRTFRRRLPAGLTGPFAPGR